MFRYDQPFTGISGLTAAPAQKAGNISQIASRVRGREAQIMSYSYDYLSRLSSSTFHNYSDAGVISGTNNYNENLTYDLRGNIQTLQRTGFYTNGSTCTYGQIDNLTYSYKPNTNRLHKVLDATTTLGDAKSRGFNGLLSTIDSSMTYDRNGNLNKNLHKNVSTITYNHLNLPMVITFTTGNTIEFLYDAAGTKLRKTVKVGATVQYIQDYLPGGIEYRQTGTGVKRVESVFHAEGRYYNTNVDASSTISWRKEYNFKDHLGNTRLVFTDRNANGVVDITGTASTSDVLQENHYYAFGLAFEGAWLQNDATARDNKYQYNGKEFNDDFGLNWNDYGARWYDAGIGRWNGVDLLIEKFLSESPFEYALNSPIVGKDPNGMRTFFAPGLGYDANNPSPYGLSMKVYGDLFLGNRFVFLNNVNKGLLSDMEFVRDWGNSPLDGQTDDRVMSAVGQISYNLHLNPLERGENLNLVGTSMGSVTIAQAAIVLLENPEKYGVFRIDNLVLGGSPIGKYKELFQRLQQLQKNGKIGQIHYDDYQIPGDDITGCAGRDDCFTPGSILHAAKFCALGCGNSFRRLGGVYRHAQNLVACSITCSKRVLNIHIFKQPKTKILESNFFMVCWYWIGWKVKVG